MAEKVERTKIPGPPGTGKTYRLIEGPNSYLRQELRKGTHPSKIAYLTFGKDPTEEVQRKLADIVKEFPKYSKWENKSYVSFPFFSTSGGPMNGLCIFFTFTGCGSASRSSPTTSSVLNHLSYHTKYFSGPYLSRAYIKES